MHKGNAPNGRSVVNRNDSLIDLERIVGSAMTFLNAFKNWLCNDGRLGRRSSRVMIFRGHIWSVLSVVYDGVWKFRRNLSDLHIISKILLVIGASPT